MKEEFGKWAKVAGAAFALGGASAPEAMAATPKAQIEQTQEHSPETEATDRNAELTGYVSDLGVSGLRVERLRGARTPFEIVAVSVNGTQIGQLTCTSSLRFTPESLNPIVQQLLNKHGITTKAREGSKESEPYIQLADRVIFEDEAKTKSLMKEWGVVIDGGKIYTYEDPTYQRNPLTVIEANAEMTFSHVGDDTIVIRYVERTGSAGSVKIERGVIQN